MTQTDEPELIGLDVDPYIVWGADDETEVEPVDDISNLRYRKGLWETRGGLFD